jgi:hypothetical protein
MGTSLKDKVTSLSGKLGLPDGIFDGWDEYDAVLRMEQMLAEAERRKMTLPLNKSEQLEVVESIGARFQT